LIFFSSDHHFGHEKIIDYCKRPFRDVHEMNDEMILRWNLRVGPQDTVYHLGDFAFGNKDFVQCIRHQLNGRIVLVRGNHDRSVTAMLDCGFDEVWSELRLSAEGKNFYLRHRPPKICPPDADFALVGHVHEKWARQHNIINVGVDQSDFYPLTLGQLLVRDVVA
jgi:calcineurin-like phosphoesterase family protein